VNVNDHIRRQAEQFMNAAKDARIPEQFQAMAEESVSKSREAFDKISAAAKDQAKAAEDLLLATQANARTLGAKLVDNTMSNTEAAFDAAQAIARAKTIVWNGPPGVFEFPAFEKASRAMAEATDRALEKAQLTAADIDLLIPHQANIRIIEATAKHAGIDMDRVFVNVDRFGNTSAASIPIALSDAFQQGRITPGTTVLFAAFGAGFTWGSMIVRF